MKRRDIIKNLTAIPFAGSFLPFTSTANPNDDNGTLIPGPLADGSNIYESIGVEPVINCRGTFTIIGGSVERPEVVAAMKAASGYFVQYDELAFGVGRRLALVTGAEWGMVSAGCYHTRILAECLRPCSSQHRRYDYYGQHRRRT